MKTVDLSMRCGLSAILLLAMLAGCMGYVPGSQSYWDAKVKEMCEKDGGVTVYERVKISQRTSKLLWGQGLPLPTENTRKDSPYFWERVETTIRDSNPKVARDRKSTRLNSSHMSESRMPSSA